MICTKKNHAGGEHCVTCIEHQVFKRLGEHRRARGIKLGKFCILCDTAAIVSLSEFWEDFVRILGKEKAVDFLIICMRRGHESLLRAVMERSNRKEKRVRVSAPRQE